MEDLCNWLANEFIQLGLKGTIDLLLSLGAIVALLFVYKKQNTILAETKKVAEEQFKALKIQKFETTFFNMLGRLDDLIINMVQLRIKKYGKPDLTGRTFLRQFVEDFLNDYARELEYNNQEKSSYDVRRAIILNRYNINFNANSNNLGHYFRYIHNIIKYVLNEFGVDTTIGDIRDLENELKELNSENRNYIEKYLNILQSQLSNDELAIILYNCLSTYSLDQNEKPKFKNWIDTFGILENIGEDYIVMEELLDEFPNTKFWCRKLFEAERKKT